MLGLTDSILEQIIVHKVGNKSRDENIYVSPTTLVLDDGVKELLHKYFLSSFKSTEYYTLYDESDVNDNVVYQFVSQLFDDPSQFITLSGSLARHLYNCSDSPKVREGDFFVTYIRDCIVDGEVADAIGLFKSESKETYLKVFSQSGSMTVEGQEGVNINKLDKGCMIFNLEREKGFLLSFPDSMAKNEEAQIWKDSFLHIRQREDNYFHTQNVIKMCKNFVTEKLPEHFDVSKADQADILNKSVAFFKDNDEFTFTEFAQEVMEQPEIIETFNDYKTQYESENEIVIADDFDISETAVKKQAKDLKSVIKLDKNFHIYVHGDRKFIKKGQDDVTGLNYYQIYFNEEQ
jgi:hypothetical protein